MRSTVYRPNFRLLYIITLLYVCAGCRNEPHPEKPVEPNPIASKKTMGAPQLPEVPVTADARLALKRMVNAYKSLHTFQSTSLADLTFDFGQRNNVRQESLIKYSQDPPRAMSRVKDPVGGTNLFYGSGDTVVHYFGISNQYVRRSVQPTLAAMVDRMHKDNPQILSPLVFATSRDLPPGISEAHLERDDVVDANVCAVVTGKFDTQYMTQISERLFGAPLQAKERTYRIWIDRKSSLMRKVAVVMRWDRLTDKRKAGSYTSDPLIQFSETVQTMIENPEFGSEEFRFFPARGAKEIFVEGRSRAD